MSGKVIMKRCIIPIVLLFMLVGTAPGTIWLYTDPTFFNTGTQPHVGSYTPGNISAFEIVNAPYFALLGQGFYTDAIPVKVSNSSNAIQIGSKGTLSQSPVQVTFGGHLENNLKYAQTKSSVRVGQQGSWSTLRTPGVL
jgi:hypothetical protein